jgi:hypothetical protein
LKWLFLKKKSPKKLVKTYASARSHQDGKIMQSSARNGLKGEELFARLFGTKKV